MTTQKRPMCPTQLFVYGTLRHDQPEYKQFCRGVTGWSRARVRGRLWLIPEGYLLLEVPTASVLIVATDDPESDEAGRSDLQFPGEGNADWPWIEGELLDFQDTSAAWPPVDEWECFVPGSESVYPRCIVPIQVVAEGTWVPVLAWAYATRLVPSGSNPIN